MSEEKSKLEKVFDTLDGRIEDRVDEVEENLKDEVNERFTEFEQKVGPYVHTDSRTSEWVDYQPGEGKAFREFVGASIRSFVNGGDRKSNTDKEFAKRYIEPFETRAEPISTDTDGGDNVLANPLYREILSLIRTDPVIDRLGITVVPMQSNTLDLPIESEKSDFAYTDEGSEITASQFDWDQKQLVKKGLKGRVRVTNDSLESNPLAAESYIAEKLMADFVDHINLGIVDGLSGGPEEFFEGIDGGNREELTTASGTSSDLDDLKKKIDRLTELVRERDVNVHKEDIKFLMSISGRNLLKRQRESGGERVYPGLREQDMNLDGYEAIESGYIKDDYDDSGDGDNDETRIFCGDFSAYWLGVLTNMRLDFDEGEYFGKDIVQWRFVGQHDGKVAFPKRLAVLSTDYDG